MAHSVGLTHSLLYGCCLFTVADELKAVCAAVESQRVELGMQFQRAISYNNFTDFSSIIPLTSVGLCATIINSSHVLSTNQDVGLYPLAEDDSLDKGLIWLPDNPNPVIPKFVTLIKEEAGK